MPDFESSRPVYSGEMFREPKPSPLEGVKPHLKKIIAIVAAIVVIYFIYWFFIGSSVEVQIVFKDTEGGSVEGVYGEITQNGARVAEISRSGQKISLKAGEYDVEANAEGFKQLPQTIEVDADSKIIPLVMEKDIDVEITSVQIAGNSEGKVFAGKKNDALITLSNTGGNVIIEIIGSDEGGIEAKTVLQQITVPANTSNLPVAAVIEVGDNISVQDRVNGDEKEISFRIKGLKEEFPKTIRVLPKLSITISPNPLDFRTLKADGSTASKDITFQNKEAGDVAGTVDFVIDIEQSNNPADEIQNWFSFNPSAIETITKTPALKVGVIVKVPTAALEDDIRGTLTASSDSWSAQTRITIKVSRANKTITQPTISPTSSSINKGEFKPATLTVKNTSDFEISNFQIQVEQACNGTFITNLEKTSIESLAKGSEQRITMNLTAPFDAESNKAQTCNIYFSYYDPLSEGETYDLPDGTQVIITPK
ncbi:MAG: hypothetical protein QT12_C0012G0003 [archaeon GW2011_AR21]|uniref:Carboxypeptidase regulatory-like domain-containing protein n=1 Tax=Candidatus Iainarchaeum sp. TaxID=3101447 RepID=A0A7J4K054_9ARCH|nr:MAG: hypothetical protein QT12_C0012G0003 [archaeon GW2011_AR21]HIH21527.1 hypothetical protein [Candidatus Diapherotrites archaeon]